MLREAERSLWVLALYSHEKKWIVFKSVRWRSTDLRGNDVYWYWKILAYKSPQSLSPFMYIWAVVGNVYIYGSNNIRFGFNLIWPVKAIMQCIIKKYDRDCRDRAKFYHSMETQDSFQVQRNSLETYCISRASLLTAPVEDWATCNWVTYWTSSSFAGIWLGTLVRLLLYALSL